ncbi:hypothetical protein BUY68_04145 [Staphylococcus epidermidis]|nr:hypothetical protein BUY68_04145 [Staphylococcus epidermidis]
MATLTYFNQNIPFSIKNNHFMTKIKTPFRLGV